MFMSFVCFGILNGIVHFGWLPSLMEGSEGALDMWIGWRFRIHGTYRECSDGDSECGALDM